MVHIVENSRKIEKEEYKKGDEVRIWKRDNVKNKDQRDRFLEKGTVITQCGKNGAIWRKEDGKL